MEEVFSVLFFKIFPKYGERKHSPVSWEMFIYTSKEWGVERGQQSKMIQAQFHSKEETLKAKSGRQETT